MEVFSPPHGYVPAPSSVEGIALWMPAPEAPKVTESTSTACPRCGAPTAFDPRTGGLRCGACDHVVLLEMRAVGGDGPERREFTLEAVASMAHGSHEVRRREGSADVLRPEMFRPVSGPGGADGGG